MNARWASGAGREAFAAAVQADGDQECRERESRPQPDVVGPTRGWRAGLHAAVGDRLRDESYGARENGGDECMRGSAGEDTDAPDQPTVRTDSRTISGIGISSCAGSSSPSSIRTPRRPISS